jgi:hypothetical protein
MGAIAIPNGKGYCISTWVCISDGGVLLIGEFSIPEIPAPVFGIIERFIPESNSQRGTT